MQCQDIIIFGTEKRPALLLCSHPSELLHNCWICVMLRSFATPFFVTSTQCDVKNLFLPFMSFCILWLAEGQST